MLDCVIYLIIYCIVAVIGLYVVEVVLQQFCALPPKILVLVRLLIGLLLLLWLLGCVGLLTGTPGGPWRLR
jgi:hypothetical protein